MLPISMFVIVCTRIVIFDDTQIVEVMSLEVSQVLHKLSDMGYIRLNKVTGNYYTMYCPFHSEGNERKPSFGVLLKEEYRNRQRYPEGWCHCFTCGYVHTLPEMIEDLLKARSITQTGLEWLAANVPGFEADSHQFESLIPVEMMRSLQNNFAVDYLIAAQQKAPTYISEEELAKYRFTVPYMYERKLTDEVIEKFDIGVDLNWVPEGRKKPTPCITFPVRDIQGRTLFIYRRSIEGKFFSAPEGTSKPVYGIDMIPKGCKSVVICESIINALTCWTWGYPAVALMGTGNALQTQQLKELGVREYVICMDGDEAGWKATGRLKRALSQNAIIWSIRMLPGKDINDLTKEEFESLYDNRE